jgi:hypothetical protein
MAPAKTALRLRAELWLWQHPYYLTHDAFQNLEGGRFTRTAACQRYYDFVRLGLLDDTGNLLYPTETPQFCKRVRDATPKIRLPFGIVRDWNTGRSVGDPPAQAWSEIQKLRDGNPALAFAARASQRRYATAYRLSEHGSVVRMLLDEKKKKLENIALVCSPSASSAMSPREKLVSLRIICACLVLVLLLFL